MLPLPLIVFEDEDDSEELDVAKRYCERPPGSSLMRTESAAACPRRVLIVPEPKSNLKLLK